MTAPDDTLDQLLARGDAAAPAIAAPGRPPLDRAGLRRLVAATGDALRGFGIATGDVVALVLPNGPEAATAFLGVAANAASAPLNPAYTDAELAFYLDDLGASLLIVPEGEGDAARRVASARGIPVADLVVDTASAAGSFSLRAESPRAAEAIAESETKNDRPAGLALILHTSGTTSRPKMVALTQRNLCASAANVARSLALAPDDGCLNVMPLFHIHGLVAAVLASLHAGGSVFCAPGFNALRFFGWLEESGATWYTAVPTMHQAVLDRAPRNAEILGRVHLRLVRSSSAALAPQVMARLEEVFRAPVIEAYGMTEAAHQMASNPLPPRPRKPGSVGVAAGPEVAIMDGAGRLLPAGEIGEVVIRGPNVTGGYLANPQANATAFSDGWLRTGDQGLMDEDGYLRLTGRLKEIINRGGEKISPREIDEALLDHPAVAQAVTFALPDEKLGEEVGAAIVLRDGAAATENEIRDFARARLAAFKVPRRVVFVAEIPKGATGKMQRIGLAEKLGLVEKPDPIDTANHDMRICVFGAGAIGSLIGARLAASGASGVEVSLVARGAHLDAIRERGLVLLEGEKSITVRPRSTDDPGELGPQDHVIVALKASSMPGALDAMAPLLAAQTSIVTAQNGIPWWFFHEFPGPFEGRRIESVDPGGRVWDALGPERAIGCVVYPSCEVIEPGVVRHLDGERLMLGEPDGTVTARVEEIAAALRAAGFRAPVRRRIRDDIWLKLWGNVSFNPVSALTMATVAEIGAHGPSIAVVRAMMEEAAAVAGALGARFPVEVETRIQWALGAGEHKTSMLQDLERGRPMEIGALVGAVAELGRLVEVATPTIDVVLGLLDLRERTASSANGAYHSLRPQ